MSQRSVESGLNLHQQVFGAYIVVVHYLLLFVLSAISMKFFSEEKSQKTFPLLLSSPLSSWQIVLAKFGGGALVAFALLVVSMAYPLSLLIFTELSWGPFLTSYFGLYLLLLVYTASGMVASAMTGSSVLAVVVGVTLNLSLLLVGTGRNFFSGTVWGRIFEFISVDYQLAFFRVGNLSLAGVVFFVSVVGVLLLICERVVEFHRWR